MGGGCIVVSPGAGSDDGVLEHAHRHTAEIAQIATDLLSLMTCLPRARSRRLSSAFTDR
jgi:hypothetical protein